MVGGAAAFGAAGPQDGAAEGQPEPREEPDEDRDGPRGLPDILRGYLSAEQRLGRVDADADVEAAMSLIVGTIHGEVLPRVIFAPPGIRVTTPPDLPGRIAQTVMTGIAPRTPGAA
jgi:hypothetical protein